MALGQVVGKHQIWTRDEINHLLAVIEYGKTADHTCHHCEMLEQAVVYCKKHFGNGQTTTDIGGHSPFVERGTEMKHAKQIIVNCWSCGKPFDVVTAERCYEHLNGKQDEHALTEFVAPEALRWTTKCSHCGACICHKYEKMQDVNCKVLNKVGIMRVMPSVKRKLHKSTQRESEA